jgi:nucleotide-binding universal stress UspA family protein
MKKILVSTYCSDLSGYALNLAQKLAKKSGAEIYALRVVPTPAEAVFNQKGELLEGEDFDIAAVTAEQGLARTTLTDWIEKSNVPLIPIVKAGNLTDQILH